MRTAHWAVLASALQCLVILGVTDGSPDRQTDSVVLSDGMEVVEWKMTSLTTWKDGGVNSTDLMFTCEVSRATPTHDSPYNTSEGDSTRFELHKKLCVNHSRRKRALVAPGTMWCGVGNLAKRHNDLGSFKDTDMCCRDHDHCPLSINGRSSKYGVFNKSPFTLSSCVCDEAFMGCLQSIGNVVSNLIGWIYFNLLPSRCLSLQHGIGPQVLAAEIRDNPSFKISLLSILSLK